MVMSSSMVIFSFILGSYSYSVWRGFFSELLKTKATLFIS